jgi:hypothetical protein
MIMVVVVAFALTGFRGWRWRTYCLQQAASYEALARACADAADSHELMRDDAEEKVRQGELSWKGTAAHQRREAERSRYWSNYWNQLQQKYGAAAAHPWRSVEPDPPLKDPALLVPN